MLQAANVDTEQASDHLNTKGDPEIIRHLREAFRRQRSGPAFARGQMVYDFDLGKVRIAPLGML